MKFDELYNKLMTEAETPAVKSRLDKLGATMSDADAAYVVIHDTLQNSDADEDKYIALAKELKDGGMSNDEYSLETLQQALEYAKQDGWDFDVSHIMELLGGNEDLERDSYEREEYQDEYEHRGWPGDGTGMDDLEDLNQREGDDY